MKRLAQWVAFAALVFGLLSMTWWLWPQFRSSGPQRPAALTMSTARPQPNAPANDASVQAATPRRPISHENQPASCKAWYGSFKNPPEGKALQAAWLAAQTQAEAQLNELLAHLIQVGTPGERAAALFLKVEGQVSQVGVKYSQTHPECRTERGCDVALNKAIGKAAANDVNTIAQMATASRDPKLYGLAINACQRVFPNAPGYCAQISAVQWAQRDPDNGTAWLNVAAAASKEGRESDKTEAVYRFTQTKRFDPGLSLLSNLARSEALTSEIPFVTSEAVSRAFQAHIQTWLPGYQVVMAYCTQAAVHDANRAQVCNDVANRLLRDDTVLLSPAVGIKLGERLAWPAQRLATIKEELDALRALQLETSRSLYSDFNLSYEDDLTAQGLAGCEAADRTMELLNTQMHVGEVQMLRDRLAAHKLSRATLAAQYLRESAARR